MRTAVGGEALVWRASVRVQSIRLDISRTQQAVGQGRGKLRALLQEWLRVKACRRSGAPPLALPQSSDSALRQALICPHSPGMPC